MNARFPVKALLVLLLPALASSPSRADDSAMYDIGGGAVAPMAQHPSVRMVSETVMVRLTAKSARVRCTFIFRNEGKAQTVKIGFPETSEAWGDAMAGGILYGFRSWVDGKPVRCVYRRGKQIGESNEGGQRLSSWYVKDVPFGAGQTRTVTDEYNTRLGYYYGLPIAAEYEIRHTFTYILRTGRNWKGPIGRARIIVDVTKVPMDHYEPIPSPKGSVEDKGTISWTLANFEPNQDISIELIPRYPRLNGRKLDETDCSPFSRVRQVTMADPRFLQKAGATLDAGIDKPYIIRYGGHTLQLFEHRSSALLDGSPIALQAPPDRGQVPVASVVRALGGTAYFSTKEHRLFLRLKPVPKPAKPRRD